MDGTLDCDDRAHTTLRKPNRGFADAVSLSPAFAAVAFLIQIQMAMACRIALTSAQMIRLRASRVHVAVVLLI